MKKTAYVLLGLPWLFLLAAILMATVFLDDRLLGGYEDVLALAFWLLRSSAATSLLSVVSGCYLFWHADGRPRRWIFLSVGILPAVASVGLIWIIHTLGST